MSSPIESLPPRRRTGDAPVILIDLDAGASRPLHRQVYDGLREAILAGRLAPGARLPATRTLAEELGISRNTVTAAFEQLRAEGYLVARRGGGTRVRAAIPDRLLAPRQARPPARSLASEATPARLSSRGAVLAANGAGGARRGGTVAVPFRVGVAATEAFPSALWSRLTARRWRAGSVWLGEGDPAGEPALREAIAAYVCHARGARCTAEQVIVVSGTQPALDLIARALLEPGDAAWVEEPGYHSARAALIAAGLRVVPVGVDDEGLDVRAGEAAAPDARLAYVTPSHQFPLGSVMSAPRRLALLAWARRAGAWVVEDDYDSEFRYEGRPLPSLQGLEATRDDAAHVLYLGTFSKTLVAGLRLGYLVVPAALAEPMRAARATLDRHPSTFLQGTLADFIGEGHYARHVRRVRALYAERQAALLAAAAPLEGLISLAPDPAGLHLVGWLPPGVSDEAAAAAAALEGVEALPLSRFYHRPGDATRGALLLGYAACDARATRSGVQKLRRALLAP